MSLNNLGLTIIPEISKKLRALQNQSKEEYCDGIGIEL